MYRFGSGMFLVNPFIYGGGGVPFDPDAQAFITAASITDPTQQSAVNQLVLDLKTANIWTKMKAVYPFVGGTATAHKWNLKDPRDLDAAYRLSFSGGFTHDSNGTQSNGTNGWANTFIAANTLTNSNLHLSWYSRTASTTNPFSNEVSPNAAYNSSNWISFRINNKVSGNAYFSAGNDGVGATVSNTLNGFFIGSETASNSRKLYRNGSAIATNTTNDTNALPSDNIAFWGPSTFSGNYSDNNCAFASIGEGLNDTEAASLSTAVQNYQTTLSRNV
jgi:hypothetical protein